MNNETDLKQENNDNKPLVQISNKQSKNQPTYDLVKILTEISI